MALLVLPELVLGLLIFNASERIGSLPMLTSGEKLVVLLGRLIKKAESHGDYSGRDRKTAGRRVHRITRVIDSWADETYSYGKQDLMSEEHEAFSKDLKLVMSGLRKCIQKKTDIPSGTIACLQNIVSEKEELHKGYREACLKCSPGGSYIRSCLDKAIQHLQAAGIDDASPEITVGYRLMEWFRKRPLWSLNLTLFVVWALLGAFILLVIMLRDIALTTGNSIMILIAYLLGFFAIPSCVHTLRNAFKER